MAIRAMLSGKLLKKGYRRGTYQAHLDRCLDHLPEGDIVLGRLFDVCGVGWRLGISRASKKFYRAETKCIKLEAADLWLFSCNLQPVYADIEFVIGNPRRAQDSVRERCSGVALSFASMCERRIVLNQSLLLMDNLDVTLHLKNIRTVMHNEPWNHGIGLPNISLEIIDKFSIDQHLNQNAVFGVVSVRGCQRQCMVYSGSLVRLWAEQNPHHHYFLCRRCGDGRVVVERCLNDAPMSETFGDISVGNEWPSITIFEQTKKENEHFQQVDDDVIFLFIKIYEPDVQTDLTDLTYVECLQVQKEMPVHKLLEKISRDVDFPIRSEYSAYVEDAEHSIKEITFETTSLSEAGLHSGSNIIIRKKRPNEEVKVEDVLRDLREKHVEQPEKHERVPCETVKHEHSFGSPASVETCSNDWCDTDEPSSGC